MPANLIFEIGTEEIPAGFLSAALPQLRTRFETLLSESRLEFETLHLLGTPRRLSVIAEGLPEKQPDASELVVGPPVRAAFEEDGTPKKAAEGFARKNGVEVSQLERAEVPGKKGEYVQCTIHRPGRPTAQVLAEALPELLRSFPWPKSMRWGWGETAFVRPIHWLVVLFAGEVLPVSFAGIDSGAESRGHRFLSPGPVAVGDSRASYESALREAHVIACPEKRENMVRAELARVESELEGASIRSDEELVKEVANLVEYPVAVAGTFDPSFLEVPEDVIVSAMRSHQRYFATTADDRLANRFVTVAGTVTKTKDAVRAGNERVLAARLSDAQFFFREDQKRSFDDWSKSLSDVVFQRKLGSIGDKVARFTSVAKKIAAHLSVDAELVARTAQLSKADLVSQMVYEFPDLQGVMGRRYAELAGEKPEVSQGIEDHYKPRGASDSLPEGEVGAIVGIADRMDSIVGCFAAGLAPTGSADPYGLRRAALAVLSILMDRKWSVSLAELIEWSAEEVRQALPVDDEVLGAVHKFLETRFRGLLSGEPSALPQDCVDAALAAGWDDIPDAHRRAGAVAELRRRDDFEPLAAAFKRVANILKGEKSSGAPDPGAFVEDDERSLWSSFSEIEERVLGLVASRDYGSALTVLSELKQPVDQFFDSVLVMDKDENVRKNRLALLGRINDTFSRIADFRQLAV